MDTLATVLLEPDAAAKIELRSAVRAAVLVALFMDHGVAQAVFTQRRHDLARHAGEISFPGGRWEPSDNDLTATALRETHEEIGLPVATARIIGALEPMPLPATGYGIYPFVAIIPSGLHWIPSVQEVQAVFELAMPDIVAGYARRRVQRRGSTVRTDTYVVGTHTIWGATARMVTDLLRRMTASELMVTA
ncbi:MAG: NUDIX hydrolase [Solirubrobacteraceae bacterium]